MIKNIYEPYNEDILSWLNADEKWPVADWDYYVMNGKNDDLVIKLANDNNCRQQHFFLHCLYYFIGDSVNGNLTSQHQKRISYLLEKVDKNSSEELQKWKKNE